MAERRARRREPSLADEIKASGETEKDPTQVAIDEVREDLRFLGREFASWLLFHAETEEGTFGQGAEGFSIRPGGRLTFKAFAGDLAEVRLAGPAPGASSEARFVLGRGAPVTQLELILEQGERAWQFTLGADTLDLARVKLPTVLSEKSDDQLDERLYLLDELDALLRQAFGAFLALRTSATWRKTLSALGAWTEST